MALINQFTAERYFPGENPVGKSIAVGVVGNVRDAGVYRPGLNVLYAPFGQFDGPSKTVSLVLRTTVEPETLS